MKIIHLLIFFIYLAVTTNAQDTITVSQASKHLGETKVVCGKVASTHFAQTSKGKPTFLNLDKPFPHQEFTIVIWYNDRANFPANPEKFYENKNVCVKGEIDEFNRVPQIVVKDKKAISIIE